jgi:hypothetical protein
MCDVWMSIGMGTAWKFSGLYAALIDSSISFRLIQNIQYEISMVSRFVWCTLQAFSLTLSLSLSLSWAEVGPLAGWMDGLLSNYLYLTELHLSVNSIQWFHRVESPH